MYLNLSNDVRKFEIIMFGINFRKVNIIQYG